MADIFGSIFSGGWREHDGQGSRLQLTVKDEVAFALFSALTLHMALALEALWPVLSRLFGSRYQFVCRLCGQSCQGSSGVVTSSSLPDIQEDGSGMFCAKATRALLADLFNRLTGRSNDRERRSPLLLLWFLSLVCFVLTIALPIVASWKLTYGTLEIPTVRSSGATCQIQKPVAKIRNTVTVRNTNLTLAANEYFHGCYQQNSPVQCQSNLAIDNLEWSEQKNATCLFDQKVCRAGSQLSRLLRFETAPLSMHQLGINTPSRLTLTRAISCGVLATDQFGDLPSPWGPDASTVLKFGSSPLFEVDVRNLSRLAPGYRLQTVAELSADVSGELDPRLRRPDGFVTVVVLEAPDVYYPDPLDDSMFSANQEDLFATTGLRFFADRVVNTAACVDQYRVCNDAIDQCGDWESPESSVKTVDHLLVSEEDGLVWTMLNFSLQQTSLHYTIWGRGASALLAQRSLFAQNQERVKKNQWREEVNVWFGVSLAKLQFNIYSIGIPIPFLSTDNHDNILALPQHKNSFIITVVVGAFVAIVLRLIKEVLEPEQQQILPPTDNNAATQAVLQSQNNSSSHVSLALSTLSALQSQQASSGHVSPSSLAAATTAQTPAGTQNPPSPVIGSADASAAATAAPSSSP